MGDKISAVAAMKAAGIPCVPGSNGALGDEIKINLAMAEKIGYPIIVKASGGGGGRGMRVVYSADELSDAIIQARTEAKYAFQNEMVYMEKYLQNPRHIEIQILADGQGNAIYLGERDCSLQRRHQKVLEEALAPGLSPSLRQQIGEICVKAALAIDYRGVGTFEFLFEADQFYFIEMNTRIQVEHCITEMVTGIDLIKAQIEVAAGHALTIRQHDVKLDGHAIECRINAENAKTFLPCPGKITHFHPPGGFGVRWESHIYTGYNVPSYYDSMIGKLITYGKNRHEAIVRMQQALSELIIEGIDTNISLHKMLLNDLAFQHGGVNIHYLTQKLAQQQVDK
ncbi:Biotin carboxylase [Halotydeus destructor]|nr:Biotin carboxylase [Halotydeus destructor]